jgi:L-alanine-DL-glutamate epimerase-like enolase superfamily enzyme
MIKNLIEYDIEFIEQQTNIESIHALAQVRVNSQIAADQSVFTFYDALNICREKAAYLIVLGLHETG